MEARVVWKPKNLPPSNRMRALVHLGLAHFEIMIPAGHYGAYHLTFAGGKTSPKIVSSGKPKTLNTEEQGKQRNRRDLIIG